MGMVAGSTIDSQGRTKDVSYYCSTVKAGFPEVACTQSIMKPTLHRSRFDGNVVRGRLGEPYDIYRKRGIQHWLSGYPSSCYGACAQICIWTFSQRSKLIVLSAVTFTSESLARSAVSRLSQISFCNFPCVFPCVLGR